MRFIILCISLLTLPVCFAGNIVLLTSLPAKNQAFEKQAQRKFISYTSDFARQGHKIIVIHQADQFQLYRLLTDPHTHALFWLSHGAYSSTNANALIKPAAMLLDHQGDNVAKVFQHIHPNIKFVGIIGCNSYQIMKQILPDREGLDYYIPAKKVYAQRALMVATRVFRYHYHRKDNSRIERSTEQLGVPLTITRKVGNSQAEFKSLKVFAGGKLIGVLPKLSANQTSNYKLYIPFQENLNHQQLKVVFDSGQNPFDGTDYIGKIELTSSANYHWKLFAKPDGTPFGVNERIFNFKGNLPHQAETEYYQLFASEDKK